jgi:hypothetical protein
MSPDIESVLPFEALLDAAGVESEEELAEAIQSDAAAMLELGEPVSLQRYATAVNFETQPRAAEAAIAAYARSLQRFENLAPSVAESMAREEAKMTANLRRRAAAPMGRAERRGTRRRSGAQLGVWTPVQLVLMFVFGAGMAVATLYWMGIVSTTRELQMQERLNRKEAERLRQHAEDEAVRIEKEWDRATSASMEIIGMIREQMEDGHLRDAAEMLLALEEVYQNVASRRPELAEAYAQTRLDGVVMPALRLIYNVEKLGGEETMDAVRDRLAQLEQERIDKTLNDHADADD